MNKLMIVGALSAIVLGASAEEFGSASVSSVELPCETVIAEQETLEAEHKVQVSCQSAEEALAAFVDNIRTNSQSSSFDPDFVIDIKDRKRNRYIVSEKIDFTIRSQDVDSKYLELREGMMSLLLLKAKVKLARLRTGTIDASKLSVDNDEETTLTRELQRTANLEMVGTTVLEQFESCREENGAYKCQIAILMSWSKESEDIAKAIQLAFKNPQQQPIRLKSGKNTIDGWARKKFSQGAFGEWLGPRRYVDENGEVWFVGIAATPREKNARRNDHRIEEARALAEAEVAWALYGDTQMTNVIVKSMTILNNKELDDLADDEKAKFGNTFRKGMKESTTMETAGMVYALERTAKDASGQEINVCVAAISLQEKRNALQDLRDMEDTAREVRAGRAAERGARDQKIGNPKKIGNNGAVKEVAKESTTKKPSEPEKGRLGTGVRHFSSDDE